jgi:hypothetical protein
MPVIGTDTSGSLFDRHQKQIEEIINKNVDTLLPTLDPAWRDTVVTSQGVGPAAAIGRDMKILKLYRGGLTGVIEQAQKYNDFVLYGDSTTAVGSKLYTQSATQTWPDALEGPAINTYRLGIGMRAMVTNLAVTMGEMQAEATPAFIGDVIAPKLKGFAQNLSHTLCNYWYTSQNSGYALGAFNAGTYNISAVNNGSTGTVTFVPSNYAIDRFYVGQRVDLYKATAGVPSTASTATDLINSSSSGTLRVKAFVSAVDELKAEVTITIVNDSGANMSAYTTSGTDNVAVCYANSKLQGGTAFTGIAGINSWLKFGDSNGSSYNAANTLLGAEYDSSNYINVNVHPEFKSFAVSSVGTLTEHKLRQYVRRFHAAKNKYGQTIDCLIASDGVWLAYEAQKIGQYTLERTGKLSSLNNEGSDQGFKFTFEGRTYNGYTSTYIEDGVVYGIKKGGNNWKRYVPPDPKGVQKFSEADNFIPFNFVVPALTGTNSTKWPILTADGKLTEAMQMPGMLRMQLVPDQAAGMKLSGVTTDRVWSST